MPEAYLTVDDSPSAGTEALTGFLAARNIPAILYCRGDRLEENPSAIIDAIRKGFLIGNHAYSHRPAEELGPDGMIAEIVKTEELIDAAYIEANLERPCRTFRFPYIDRGDGDRLERHFDDIIKVITEEHDLPVQENEAVKALQKYLKEEGYVQPFAGIAHPLYRHPVIAGAADSLFTFSAGDWMMTERHKGKWPYKTLSDLKRRIDDDPFLWGKNSRHIVLFHDQDEIRQVTVDLIAYMQDKGICFLPPASMRE